MKASVKISFITGKLTAPMVFLKEFNAVSNYLTATSSPASFVLFSQ